ncbi:MAG: hypothetical protein GY716_06305 [bacterium]|nr:hypothetical protein [bacterium]
MVKNSTRKIEYTRPRVETLDVNQVVESLGPASAGYGPSITPVPDCQTENKWGENYCDC